MSRDRSFPSSFIPHPSSFLKAAINGGRARAEHPRVPITPDEIAADVLACVAAGAAAIHFHVRGSSGNESLSPDDVGTAIAELRRLCPEIPIGISTGAWITRGPSQRLNFVKSWTALPDFASVNMDEEGSIELAETLLERGVGVEAGLATTKSAQIAVSSGLLSRCMRILIEPQQQDFSEALANLEAIEAILTRDRSGISRVLHGTGATSWPMLAASVRRGCGQRIGLEDVLVLPDGSAALDNAALVRAARQIIEEGK